MDAADAADPGDLMARIEQQVHASIAESLREQVTDKCFGVCVTSPSKALTSRESTCIERCLDRFVGTRRARPSRPRAPGPGPRADARPPLHLLPPLPQTP